MSNPIPDSEQVIPQSLESEQGTLGAMIIEPDAIVEASEIVTAEMFKRPLHQKIFAAILALHDRNVDVNLITLVEELRDKGNLEEVGGAAYLGHLEDACPNTRIVSTYAHVVKSKFVLRELLKASEGIKKDVFGCEGDVDAVVEKSERRLQDVGKSLVDSVSFALSDLVAAQRERIFKAAQNPQGSKGVPSGFYDLDKLTNGFKPSQLITVAGMSSMGKSAFASQIAYNTLKLTKRPVFVFSLEMDKEQWIDRMVASEARINGFDIENGTMTPGEWDRLTEQQEIFAKLPMFVVDTPAMTTREIKAQCRRLASLHGVPALIVVDYLQIAELAEKTDQERIRVTRMIKDFKNLARIIKAPVICLSQLTRSVNTRENKRPTLSDLRETSAIEAESDVVLFVYRPSYYKAPNEQKNEWVNDIVDEPDEIIIGKQRKGPRGGIVPVKFIPEYARFENLHH